VNDGGKNRPLSMTSYNMAIYRCPFVH